MRDKWQRPRSVAPTPASPALYIPVARFLLVGLAALLVGVASSFWTGATLIAIVISVSIALGYWVSRYGDAFVVAVAVLLFWLPFHTTASQFNVSPQELATYGVCLVAAVADRRGARHWISGVVTSIPIAARFAIVLLTLAILQSLLRIQHRDFALQFASFRTILVYPVLLALLAAYAIATRRCEQALMTALYWGGVFFAGYALSLRVMGVDIMNGAVAGRLGAEASFLSQYHPNNLSLYLALALAFAPAVFLAARRGESPRTMRLWHSAGVVGGALLMLVALWLTFSRGAFVGLIIALILILIFFVFSGTMRQRLTIVGVFVLSVLGLGGFLLVKGDSALGRYGSLLDPSQLANDPNVQFRVQLFQRAYNLASAHPFTGIGLGQFSEGAAAPFSPHNTYLDLWVTIGLIGLIAFVAVLVLGMVGAMRAARYYMKQRSPVPTAFMLGIVAVLIMFLVQAFVESYDTQPRITPVIWFVALAAQALWFRIAQERAAAHATHESIASETDEAVEHAKESPAEIPAVAGSRQLAGAGGGRFSRMSWAGRAQGAEQLRAAPVTVVLPAIERPWNFETGQLPAIDNFYDSVTDFSIPALRITSDRRGPASRRGPVPSDGQSAAPPGQNGAKAASAGASEAGQGAEAAEALLQRAPTSYLWNQLYSLWFFAINFILSVVITRGLSRVDYGVYAILSTIVSMLLFLLAFGFEDVATVFLPRVLSLQGQGAAGRLIRRLIAMRLLVMGGIWVILAVGLTSAVPALQHIGLLPAHFDQSVAGHFGLRPALMGAYLAGSSVVALETAFFAAVLKSRITLIVGGISQFMIVALTLPLLKLGFGVDGIFGVQALVSWATAVVYLIELVPFLKARSRGRLADGREVRKLMFGAWLTNVTNGALGKQMDIMLMSFFAVSFASIGYYNLAYQLGSIVSVLLISGLGGVGMASMSAALAAGGRERLASMWSASLMLQILLAVPLQIICFALADQIIVVLYGAQYAGAAPLLRIYLVFSILGRFIGGGSNQSGLYIVGRQRSVLVVRWFGLVLNVILDVIFIQVAGPAGALFATGFTQAWVGIIEYLLLRPLVPVRYPSDFATRVACISGLPAIVLLWWTPGGLIGLVARSALFVVLFVAGLLIVKLGNADDLTDMINANPKLRKLVTAVGNRLPSAWTRRGRSGVAPSVGQG